MTDDNSYEHLLKLRIVVGRYGEMDRAQWWNTNGIMGPKGGVVLERGFPHTHPLVQARSAFSVARERCTSMFSAPKTITLWNLPAKLEDQFESHWSRWLSQSDQWEEFMLKAHEATSEGLSEALTSLGLVEDPHIESVSEVRTGKEGKSVSVLEADQVDGDVLKTLAAGFILGDTNDLVIPFATFNS